MVKPTPARYHTANWSSCNQAHRALGVLLIRVDKKMAWYAQHEGCPGRPPIFSNAAIQFCLSIKVLFNLPRTRRARARKPSLRLCHPITSSH